MWWVHGERGVFSTVVVETGSAFGEDRLAKVTSSTSMSTHRAGSPILIVSCFCSTHEHMCSINRACSRSIVAWPTPVNTCAVCRGTPARSKSSKRNCFCRDTPLAFSRNTGCGWYFGIHFRQSLVVHRSKPVTSPCLTTWTWPPQCGHRFVRFSNQFAFHLRRLPVLHH